MRIAAIALAAILATVGAAHAQDRALLPRTTAVPPSTVAPSATPQMQAGQFSTEGDAKVHCSGQNVVWMNNPSKIYHWAGSRDYGRTKNGAYMCQADADKIGRAAKNEKAPTAARQILDSYGVKDWYYGANPVPGYAAEGRAFGAREAKDKSMAELNLKETQQLLAGTWIGIACIAELLIQRKLISRDDLTAFLWTTERMTSDRYRRDALAVMRRLIEQALGRDLSREGASPSNAVIEKVIHEVLVPANHPRDIDPYGPDKVVGY